MQRAGLTQIAESLLVATTVFVGLACNDTYGGAPRTLTGPSDLPGLFEPIIHTTDGRHLVFAGGGFQPNAIDHCRDDGKRYLTSIFELSRIQPIGRSGSLCPGIQGQYRRLYLTFLDSPAVKVTLFCGEFCEPAGGYYPPLGTNIYLDWSEISSIEIRRE